MTEFNIGDKVKITGTDGSYTIYQVWADMVGSKRFTRGKYPSLTGELEVISVAPHQSQNVTLYLLGGDEGEFIFDNSFGDIELVEKKPRTKVEYSRINVNDEGGKYWEVARDWSEGKCDFRFMRGNGDYDLIDSNEELLNLYTNRKLYRRIETPMTEREAFIESMTNASEEFTKDMNVSKINEMDVKYFEFLFDSGCRFVN